MLWHYGETMSIDHAPSSSELSGEFATVSSLIRHANEAADEIIQNATADADKTRAESARIEAEARLLYSDAQAIKAEATSLLDRANESFENASTDAKRIVESATEQSELCCRPRKPIVTNS